MNRKLAFGLALLTILMVVSATSMPTQAATYKVGVAAGNTADYTLSASFPTVKNITKVHLSIHNVTTTVAGLDLTFYWNNGSVAKPTVVPIATSFFVDVTSTNGSGGYYTFLIAQNLSTHDPAYPTDIYTINQSTTMIVAGVNRTVNHLKYSYSAFLISGSVDVYWDKATGILVKQNSVSTLFGWYNFTMTATNMWSSGGLFGLSTTTLVIIVVVVVVIIAAIVLLRRRK